MIAEVVALLLFIGPDIKSLHSDMNKGKGVISFFIILGGLIGAAIGFFKWNG